MYGMNAKYSVVPLVFPIDFAGGKTSDIINLKNYNIAEIYFMTGVTITAAFAVTLYQGINVVTCATALNFPVYYQTGMMLKYKTPSTGVPAAAGETATGASTAVCTVYEDRGGYLVANKWNSTAFVDGEALTFSGGRTALVDGIRYNEDIMIPTTLTATNTFNVTNVIDVHKLYCIPIKSSMLTAGNSTIKVTFGDPTLNIGAAWAVLSEPRFAGIPMETAIY